MAGPELWTPAQVAAYLGGLDPRWVRKKLHRAGIAERRGYPPEEVMARWPTPPPSAESEPNEKD